MATSGLVPVTRALISVSDKTGLAELAKALRSHGAEILSTGGTAKAIADAGVPVTEVSDHTGFPEIMDGRVKTLHPSIHGGLLGRRDLDTHVEAMTANNIAPIDLIVVNLYPFEQTVSGGAGFDDCIENIDIGGPAMIRSAAKNHAHVAVVTDAAQYDDVLAALETHKGATPLELRRHLAATAFARTATYDAAISRWFTAEIGDELPARLAFGGARSQLLRYGENPHQSAALYLTGEPRPGVATAEQVQGKELSYNNLNDTDAAFECVAEFDRPAVAIIKHANPCGVATSDDIADAYTKALACDPVSAFGGIIAVNRPLDAAAAEKMIDIFTEVIIAPDADADAKELVAGKKNLRLLLTGGMPDALAEGLTVRSIAGGLLIQGRDNVSRSKPGAGAGELKIVTKRIPTKTEIADMVFAFTVCKHVKSNAIVYAKDRATVGIGAGQMSRVDSSRIAAWKAQEMASNAGENGSRAQGSVVASDAFFPFADGLLTAAEAGATAVIQPGGSMRDDEVIAAADEAGLAMVFTGHRHFRH